MGTLLAGVLCVAAAAAAGAPAADYEFVLLTTGQSREPVTAARQAEMQRAHRGNLGRLAEVGYNLMAGPLGDGGKIRGIAVLDLPEGHTLQQCFEPDPFVEHGYLDLVSYSWTVSTGAIGKPAEPFSMEQYSFALVARPAGESIEAGREAFEALEEVLVDEDTADLLALAGPVRDDPAICGILFFRSADPEAVDALLMKSPDVGDGALDVELHPVYVGVGCLDGEGTPPGE